MKGYLIYLLTRLGQFTLVVFIGINIAFIVTHATPIDPVEQSIAAATQYRSTSPEAIALMRQSLKELYGLDIGLADQYLAFRSRVPVRNSGPSLSAFPTPTPGLAAHCFIPFWSLLLVVLAGGFMGMRSLVSLFAPVVYVVSADLGGVEGRCTLASDLMGLALAPPATGVAMSLGAISNGPITTVQ